MAFMIVCAQSKSPLDGNSLQNSLNNSYISNDSAIAECGGQKWQYNKIPDSGNNPDGNNNFYGQYYFDPVIQITQSVPLPRENDERTPLRLGLNHKNYENTGGLLGRKPDLMYASQPNLDSCSIDLGIAVKNSACLVKRDTRMNSGSENPNFAHDENGWLNSKWIVLPLLPITLTLKLLTPLKFKNTCWTIWTFIVSVGLIGALTYISVWMVHLFGQAMGIPETVAGMTILSWGTGIPELIASVVLIKKTAQADMAICNTIGSNVIDASFCLSLPW